MIKNKKNKKENKQNVVYRENGVVWKKKKIKNKKSKKRK